MLSVVQEEDPPRAPLHQERNQRRVRLGGVAVAACENQVVGTVVRGLAAPGPDMVQRDGLITGLGAAVCAHGAVKTK